MDMPATPHSVKTTSGNNSDMAIFKRENYYRSVGTTGSIGEWGNILGNIIFPF
jgi:hypothetical protein